MIELILAFIVFVGGVVLIAFASKIAVKNSALLASALGISPLIIGITLVSIGTDITEIVNSIYSSSRGIADINIADSIGSVMTQITLVFGILPLVSGVIFAHRKDIIILGSCLILSLVGVYTVIEKGFVTRLNALFLVGSLAIYIWLIYVTNKESILKRVELLEIQKPEKKKIFYLMMAIIGFVAVTIASVMIVESIQIISTALNVPPYILSFFLLSFGTSLPELAVGISALKAGHHAIAIGDILGSCIVDATLSIGIGLLIFPQPVTASLAIPTILYTMLASIIVTILIAIRKKIEKITGIIFIGLYAVAFLIFFVPVLFL